MTKQTIHLSVNGRRHEVAVDAKKTLVDALREDLFLTGTKECCGVGVCGACTVLLEGMPVSGCLTLAVRCQGKEITTIEGLEQEDGALDPVQEAFAKHWGFQCGYCTPGMILTVKALLAENAKPGPQEIRHYLAGNICRCTGYASIVKAVQEAAGTLG
ncbi:MAG: (2Fe-2S)-binding protein [Candidatus Tectomicrobia bacterium]|nr:(2Fe-2S)-binding protein [Candidatus Tectomicrobia bacterium]